MTAREMMDADALDRRMRPRLIRLDGLRKVVRMLTIAVYSATLCWFAFCLFSLFSGRQVMPVQSENTWMYMMAGFAVFCLLHFALMSSLTSLKNRETALMREAVRQMFPDARYRADGNVPRQTVTDSRLFDVFDADGNPAQTTGYGRIEFRNDGGSTSVYDIGVTSDRQIGIMERIPVLSMPAVLYRLIVRPIFGTPIESAQHGFRGMFGVHAIPQSCKGSVILLPDHLEGKLGYLAHSVQSYKSKNGARLVLLEDPEFENLFAVYADNEVEARKILTPAMMRRIVKLRGDFGKDLMLSFSENRICYAVPFPDGFLQPTRDSLKERGLFGQIYKEVRTGLDIPKELFP